MHANLTRDIMLGIENLLLHKLRSFLTMLGVVFGVGSVVAMLSVGEGASKDALDQIRKVGSNNIILKSVRSVEEQNTSTTSSRGPTLTAYGITYSDFERIVSTFETVHRAVPVKEIRKEGRLADKSMELRVVGTTPEWFELVKRDVMAGRVMISADVTNQSSVVVLTETGARKLLATRNTIGQKITISGSSFKVIGIVKSEGGETGSDIQLPDQEVDAYIPIDLARVLYGDTTYETGSTRRMLRVELHQVIVEVDDISNVETTSDGIEYMLEEFHSNKDYEMSVPLALLRQAEATKRTFNIVLGSIAGISLLVGGIGIMNIMLASVTERTREIGIRRAIGAKRKQIIIQFLIETVVLSTIGGIVGIGVGVFIPVLITLVAGMPTVVTAVSIMLPLFISVGIGIVFGLYPAARAAEVDPIIALRHE